MPDPLFRKAAEKWLFVTLWGLVLLAFGLWRFWPSSPAESDLLPQVEVGEELRDFFDGASVTETLPSHYALNLRLSPDYRNRLDRKQLTIALGFDLFGSDSLLYRGEAPCLIHAEQPSIRLELPNPERISARRIRLHLAQ